MTDNELLAISDIIRDGIREHLRSLTSDFLNRLSVLETRESHTPRDGKDADPEFILAEVTRQIAALPTPKDGVSPAPVDMVQVRSMVDDAVIMAADALPKPKDGRDGVDGKDLAPMSDVEFYEKTYGQILAHLESGPSGITKAVQALVRAGIDSIPAPHDGKDAPPVDTAVIVAEVLSKLPAPVNGKAGDQGETGHPGIAGKDGERGIDGKDADPVDTAAIVREVLTQIPVPANGKDGASGVDGRDGEPGLNGKDAEPPHPDTIALMVNSAVDKRAADTPKPKDGPPGRDASELDILPSLDRTRSVSRGTLARHAGGLMRAFRDTDASKDGDGPLQQFGWECIFDGIAEPPTLIQSDDFRTFTLQMTLTSGRSIASKFTMPVILDAGIWADGKTFVRGDVTNYDGSMWICQVDGAKSRPGTSAEWRLSVKRGAAGKDLRAELAKPPQGPVKL